MPYKAAYKIGPRKTPLSLKVILLITISLSLISVVLSPFFRFNYPLYFLGLSLQGIKNFYLWQFLSYNFIQPGYGLNIGYLVHLVFNIYLIWTIGALVIEKSSQISFVLLYVFSTIFSGLIMSLIMLLNFKSVLFAGTSVGLYTCLVAWMMLNPPDMKIFLYFAMPIKLSWIVLALLGFNLFIDLSNMDMVHFFGYASAAVFTYFYSVIIWSRHSPFKKFDKLERELIYFFRPKIDKFRKK